MNESHFTSLSDDLHLHLMNNYLEPEARYFFSRSNKHFRDLYEKYNDNNEDMSKLTKSFKLAIYATKYNNLNMLKDIMTPTTRDFRCNAEYITKYDLTNLAASLGHLEILQWAIQNDCAYFERAVLHYAAKGGRRNVLEWAMDFGFSGHFLCEPAAQNGQLETIKWLREVRHCDWGFLVCAGAAKYGHLDVIKYARNNGCKWDHHTCDWAARFGHLEVLKWARDNGCEWTHETCDSAAAFGHFEILKWARENGCPWTNKTCDLAAIRGRLDIIMWARLNGCEWSNKTCDYAAENGHLSTLMWARRNGCEWTHFTCDDAARNGHFEILKWAREN